MATKNKSQAEPYPTVPVPEKAPAPRPRTMWRTWAKMPDEDLVEIPRTLALDLVKALNISAFLHAASEEDCEAGLHEMRFEAHKDRMERIVDTLVMHLTHEDVEISADLILRSLVMAYETAPDIPGVQA